MNGLAEGSKYEFCIIAMNSAGSISVPSQSTGPITAKDEVEPAQVDVDACFRDVVNPKAGDNFLLEAYTKGKPVPQVSWWRNDTKLVTGPRTTITVSIICFTCNIR